MIQLSLSTKEKMATIRKDMSERVVARCESMIDHLIQVKFLMESVPTSVQLLAKGAENNL